MSYLAAIDESEATGATAQTGGRPMPPSGTASTRVSRTSGTSNHQKSFTNSP